jgi:hypothetical protein
VRILPSYPWARQEPPACSVCHDAQFVPDPFSDTPGAFLPCPTCNRDGQQADRWGIAGSDGADLVDLASLAARPAQN